jgi:hypothetical protein
MQKSVKSESSVSISGSENNQAAAGPPFNLHFLFFIFHYLLFEHHNLLSHPLLPRPEPHKIHFRRATRRIPHIPILPRQVKAQRQITPMWENPAIRAGRAA